MESEIDPMDMTSIRTIRRIVYLSPITQYQSLRLENEIELVMVVFMEYRLEECELWMIHPSRVTHDEMSDDISIRSGIMNTMTHIKRYDLSNDHIDLTHESWRYFPDNGK